MRALVLLLLLAVSQQPPPRDPVPRRDSKEPSGSASVAGQVVSAASGAPIQGATVVLVLSTAPVDTAAYPRPPRNDTARGSVTTDALGRFRINGVAAGSYRVIAMPPSFGGRYLPAGFAAPRGNDPGKILTLADGAELRNVNIALPLGLAIEGRVTDDGGEPLARMPVFAARIMTGSDTPQRVSHAPATTDDLGRYRVYGLEPGEYVVGVEGRGFAPFVNMEWAALPPRTFTAMSSEQDLTGFVTTFHPASLTDATAQRVRLSGPNDVVGIDISLTRARRLMLSGIVVDSQGTPANSTTGAFTRVGFGITNRWAFRTDASGRFHAGALEPGEYRVLVGSGLASGLVSVNGRTEFADVALTLTGDVDDLTIVTQPGIGLAGQIVFEDGAPARAPSLKIAFRRPDVPGITSEPVEAMQDDAFRFYGSDLFGPQLIRVSQLSPGWVVKAVTLHGADITDVPTVFTSEHDGQVHIVLSSRPAAIEGQLRGEGTAPPGEATLYVFAQDRSSWNMTSPRTRMTDVGRTGKFTIDGLAAGHYYAIAIAREGLRLPPSPGAAFFELLSKEATPFEVGEGERRPLELQLWRWPE